MTALVGYSVPETITDDAGNVLKSLTVQVTGPAAYTGTAVTGAGDGVLRLGPLPVGDYTVTNPLSGRSVVIPVVAAAADVQSAFDKAAAAIPLTQKGAVNGVASLDGAGTVPDAQIPATIARDAEVSTAVSAAVAALVASAPGALDTLAEIDAQLASDESAAAALTAEVSKRWVIVSHGSTAGTARPTSVLPVMWQGTVAPTNAVTRDRWYDESTELEKRYNGTSWQVVGSGTYVSQQNEAALAERAFVVVGGDHPYIQWPGMAKAYTDRGLTPYMALNTDSGTSTDLTPLASVAAQFAPLGVEVIGHGARHIQDWNRINTGIQVLYGGANATATVQISATQFIATAGADSVTVTLAGTTLAQLRTAVQAVTGWTLTLAPELTGSEQAANLLQIAATSVKGVTVLFAAGGGITIQYTGGYTYRTTLVLVQSSTLKLYGDGRRLLSVSLTGGATLNTIVTAINAVSGFTANLCDNGKSSGPTFESYVSGSELAVNLAVNTPGVPCQMYPAHVPAGLPRWYMIDRQFQRNVDAAAAAGVTLRDFASSGTGFLNPFGNGHGQFRSIRGNQFSDEDTSFYNALAFPAYLCGKWRPVTGLTQLHYPAGSGRLQALMLALADSPGFMVDALMHKVLADGSSGYSFPTTDATYYDQTETDFISYLNTIQAQVTAGKLACIPVSKVPATFALAARPTNYVFNPNFRHSNESLAGISGVERVYQLPSWNLNTAVSVVTAVSVDANNMLNLTSAAAGQLIPAWQTLYLEPGKTYEFGAYVEVDNYTTGNGVSLLLQTFTRGWERNASYGGPGQSRSAYATGISQHLKIRYTVPTPEEIQHARIMSVSFGAGINMSVNKNIKLRFWGKTLDNLDLSAGAALNTSVQAVEAAAAINAALLAAVKAGTFNGEFTNLARSENNQLIIEMPMRGPDGTFLLTVIPATTADISATVFGTTDSYSVHDFASQQDASLVPIQLKFTHDLATGTNFRIGKPYCSEVAVR